MIASPSRPAPAPAAASPALRALVVYLRPAPRAALLTALANLGVFVTEVPAGTDELPAGPPPDLGLLVASSPEHASLCTHLAAGLRGRVAVVVPDGASPAAFLAAGASAVLSEGEVPARLTPVVARLAAAARRARGGTQPAAGGRVFADLAFVVEPPQLRNGTRVLPLARSERDVLRCLVEAHGRPVAQAILETQAAGEALAHPGLLKAVILRLRRKAHELGGDGSLLTTIRGVGYALRG